MCRSVSPIPACLPSCQAVEFMTQTRRAGEKAAVIVVHVAWMGICGIPDDILERMRGAPAARALAFRPHGRSSETVTSAPAYLPALSHRCSQPAASLQSSMVTSAGPNKPYLIARAARRLPPAVCLRFARAR